MTTGWFKVIRASAGSGKTYSLVREYLLLALRTNAPWYYKHILAITFTNAAAAEMKERVLARLKDFARASHHSELFEEIRTKLDMPEHELKSRADAVFRHMLHNYGQLSILTIDSFTHKLIRSFARDLQLSHDFSIEVDGEAFIEALVDRCLESVGKDSELTTYLEMFALENLEDGASWNIRKVLIVFARILLSEESTDALEKIKHLDLDAFRSVRQRLHLAQKSYEDGIVSMAERIMMLLDSRQLVQKDFFNGGSGSISFIRKILKGEFARPGSAFYTLLRRDDWSKSSTAENVKMAIATIQPELAEIFRQIDGALDATSFGAYQLRKLILHNLYAMGLLGRLNELAKELKQENNMLLIADFHKLVNEVVKDNEAPFIYERIGTRYRHIMMDEFQDTSALQWSNAIPLMQNALSENNLNLLVGDAKQSIYRWRGGRVEQFVDLPQIPIGSSLHASGDFFSHHFHEEILKENYRSSNAIVAFNNLFYEELSKHLGDYQPVYNEHRQVAIRPLEGYVRIDVSPGRNKAERWEKTSKSILNYVEECLNDGYRPSDIAILTRSGESEGGRIAALLHESNYQVVTQGSFLLENSPKVRAVISFLEYAILPDKKFVALELVRSLSEINDDISIETFVSEFIDHTHREPLIRLHDFLKLHFGSMQNTVTLDTAYTSAAEVIRYLHLESDVYLEFLLEHIRDKCIARNMSLATFIAWWNDSKHKLYISSAFDENAIRILTIHKSKGLQFPVVIYPRFASQDKGNDIWIDLEEHEHGIATALVKSGINAEPEGDIEWPREFYDETAKSRLDDLNICYVATTRAEDRLYMIHETGGTATWLSKTIDNTLKTTFEIVEQGTWLSGNRSILEAQRVEIAAHTIRYEPTASTKHRLRTAPVDYNEEMTMGSVLHECLAEILTTDDVLTAVNHVARASNIHDEETKKHIVSTLLKIISNTQVNHWFLPGLDVITERDLLTASGKMLRPDRIVVYAEHVDVIDYKTGSAHIRHHQQVNEYMRFVGDLFSKPVNGYLLYTEGPEVVAVSRPEGQTTLF